MAAGASFRNLRHVGEHLTKDVAISQRTHHMKIGTAIMVLPSQHPLRVAEYAAMVDSLSGGRLMLGVGRGYQPPEFQALAWPKKIPGKCSRSLSRLSAEP